MTTAKLSSIPLLTSESLNRKLQQYVNTKLNNKSISYIKNEIQKIIFEKYNDRYNDIEVIVYQDILDNSKINVRLIQSSNYYNYKLKPKSNEIQIMEDGSFKYK